MPRFLLFSLLFLILLISPAASHTPVNYLNNPILKDTSQIIFVELAEGSIFKAKVTAWQKKGANWEMVASMNAVVGRNGIAAPGEKREGDGKTPSGSYDLKTAFGYLPSFDTKLEYLQMTKEDVWVDDPESKDYNQLRKISKLSDAKSFENMKRNDDLYKVGLVIEYNTQPVIAGMGSAIFMHIWRDFDKPTAGCVAMAKENIYPLLQWLNPSSNPKMIIR